MKVRTLALGVLASVLMPATAQAAAVVLKVAHFLPPASPAHTRFIVPWCERIKAESKGGLECQIYPAMQLGGTPPQLLTQVRDGVADVVWTLPGYTAGRFPVSEVFELPFITAGREASSRALWDLSQSRASQEFAGMKPIATWVTGPYALHLRDHDVSTLEGLAGLKVRAPSRLGTKLLAALGATPVGMPVPQMAESLSKRVIDGALLPWEVLPATKVHELTRFHVEVSGDRALLAATMIFVMNEKKYDSLPIDLKKVIDANSGRETSAWVSAQFVEPDEDGRKRAQERGNAVRALAADEVAKWQAAAGPVTAGWVEEITAKGMDGRSLHEEARALIDKYSK